MKAAGALQITRFGYVRRATAAAAAMYLVALLLAPAAAAQSTGEIDLELDKSVAPQLVEVGDNVTWTITVSNQGSRDATGVEVGDLLPDGVTYVSHTGAGNFDASSGTWAIGTVSIGSPVTVSIVTSVDVIGDITNEAEVTMADQDDIDSIPGDGTGDDWDDASVRVVPTGSEFIDLELTKTADPTTVVVGGQTDWTVSITNQGPDPASGVEATVYVPGGVTYVSHSGDGNFDPGSAIWAVGDVAVGEILTLTIKTTVNVIGDVTCSAEVTMAEQEDVDSIPGDGTGDDWDDATVTSEPTGSEIIDLELTKTANPVEVQLGGQTTWTIDLVNQGPDDATSVEVHVDAPMGSALEYVSHSGDGNFTPGSGTWSVGDLGAGESVSLQIVTTILALGDITCVAEVTMADQEDIDSVPADGTGDDWDDATVTSTTTGDELIDLELTKDVSPASVAVGAETTWSIELTNKGPDTATGVAVTVDVPSGVTYVSHDGDGSFNSNTAVWTVGVVDVDQILTLQIVTTVDAAGSWTCAAEVTAADQEDVDSVPGDGTGDDWDDATVEANTVTNELIDLELTKSADPAAVAVGEETTWTVELTNKGPDDATGVEVTVTPPDGITYVSHLGLGDFDPASGVWTVGDLAVDAVVTLEMVTTVDEEGEFVCVAEVTAADQTDVDSEPGDGEGDDWDDALVVALEGGNDVIDLELTKSVYPTEVDLGATAAWTVDLVNQGPADATGVEVTVAPPTAVTYVSHTGDGAFEPTSGIWTVGDLDVGETVTLTIVTTADAIGIWTCEAEVTAADQEDVDSVPGDGEGDDWDDATIEVASVQASAIIGDTVWLDTDADGIQDAGETGVSAVTVVLTNIDTGTTATQITNADGLYLFSALEPGNYRAAVDMNTVDSKLGLTTAGSFTISLADNDAYLTADFGLSETLPVTGFDPIPVAIAGLILVLLGAVALELTWPEREGRRMFVRKQV
ncbi:MAG: DUF11 domain-containing protein [bacterium]|nr:DUF11 domain-containing protein [bacterium]